MALELFGSFSDKNWYVKNIDTIRNIIMQQPSFVSKKGNDEFWLKSTNSKSSWDYDVRIFVRQNEFIIEASVCNDTLYKDVKQLLNNIFSSTKFSLLDDDGEPFPL